MGYAENATLSVQHQLPGNMLIEVAGQSVLGRRLDFDQNYNEVPPYLWGISGNNYANRPFPQYGSVTEDKGPDRNVELLRRIDPIREAIFEWSQYQCQLRTAKDPRLPWRFNLLPFTELWSNPL